MLIGEEVKVRLRGKVEGTTRTGTRVLMGRGKGLARTALRAKLDVILAEEKDERRSGVDDSLICVK